MFDKTLVIAHRGYSAQFPENTLAAFQGAIAAEANMIELDVHLTRDGALLVTHDFQLGRTSNGKGPLSALTSRELRSLDAGAWFSDFYKGERFPVLGEVLAMVKGKAELNVELKEETIQEPDARNAMVEKVLAMARGHGMLPQILISSFDWRALARVRELESGVRIGLLNDFPERGLRWEEALPLRAHSYNPNLDSLTEEAAREIHAKGLKLFPFTANTREEFRKALTFGADGIFTNEVEKLKDFLKT
jgi:glycerophosphoryl diester phosphodiesterase